MIRLVRHPLEAAASLPPAEFLSGLPAGCEPHLLDAGGAEGWGTAPGGGGAGLHVLAAQPDRHFSGGLDALGEAERWLAAVGEEDPAGAMVVGSLAYEWGATFETRFPGRARSAPVRLAGFRAHYRFCPVGGRGEVVGSSPAAVERLAKLLREAAFRTRPVPAPRLPPPTSTLGADAYRAGVEQIRAYIRAGDIYQANLSRRLDFPAISLARARAAYAHLSGANPAPFSAYLEQGERAIVSNSPERFVRRVGREVETCPIKGTRPRGGAAGEDTELAAALEASEKDCAEHVMIVDLERNDLGRVCETGSVRVARLAALRSFATVHHLVSSVRGRLRPEIDNRALFAATFPGGSITGAPKLRAVEIIDTLEPVPRDVYTGSIVVLDAAGNFDTSIAIRTAIAEPARLSLHLGGGIVADSLPDAELRETEDKGRAFARLWTAP